MLVLFSSIAIFMFHLSGNYYYIFAVMVVYAFFQTPITPIGDAITLEYITDTKWKYGPIRLAVHWICGDGIYRRGIDKKKYQRYFLYMLCHRYYVFDYSI